MSLPPPRRLLIVLLLVTALAAPPAMAAAPASERGFRIDLADLLADWWGSLVSVWDASGMSIDPDGAPSDNSAAQGEEGGSIDPNGSTAPGDSGGSIDPNG